MGSLNNRILHFQVTHQTSSHVESTDGSLDAILPALPFEWEVERPNRGLVVYTKECPVCHRELKLCVLSRELALQKAKGCAIGCAILAVLLLTGALILSVGSVIHPVQTVEGACCSLLVSALGLLATFFAVSAHRGWYSDGYGKLGIWKSGGPAYAQTHSIKLVKAR